MDIVNPGEIIPTDRFYLTCVDPDGTLRCYTTPHEVVADLHPGYDPSLGETETYRARWEVACSVIRQAQKAAMDTIDPTTLTFDQAMAASSGGRRAVTEVKVWDGPVPLYVSAVYHAPYTDTPLPTGQGVVVIDPSTEVNLVTTLVTAGILDAVVAQGGAVWDPSVQMEV